MDEIITKQYFDDTGSVNDKQVLLPKNLQLELLESLQGKAKKHPGTSKMLQELRTK